MTPSARTSHTVIPLSSKVCVSFGRFSARRLSGGRWWGRQPSQSAWPGRIASAETLYPAPANTQPTNTSHQPTTTSILPFIPLRCVACENSFKVQRFKSSKLPPTISNHISGMLKVLQGRAQPQVLRGSSKSTVLFNVRSRKPFALARG